MIEAAGAILGGLAFRIRGGLIPLPSTQLARGLYALLMAAIPTVVTMNQWWMLLAPLLFLGSILRWFETIDLGKMEGEFGRDFWVMAARGLVFTIPALPLLWWLDAGMWWAGIGALCPAAYWLGWKTKWATAAGEVLFGALLGGTLVLAS